MQDIQKRLQESYGADNWHFIYADIPYWLKYAFHTIQYMFELLA